MGELAEFYNNHIGLWYHRQEVLPKAILIESRGPLPKNIEAALFDIREKLSAAEIYFRQLP